MTHSYVYSGNVIDIEASGMGKDSYPIEIAMVTHSGAFYQSLILPDENWTYWSEKAERIHGISRENITRMGRSAKQVCEDINKLFKGQAFYSDCWPLDSKWLTTLFEAANMTPSFAIHSIDYILDDKLISDWNHDKSQRAKEESITQHRALADAYLIKSLLDDKIDQLDDKIIGFDFTPKRESTKSFSVNPYDNVSYI